MARANGECGKYVGEGRFNEKGGQQVSVFFDSSSDNEKIKHVYGNYGFWSWLRYWYLDTANQVAMMLIDKGYYDYDCERNKQEKRILYEETVMDDTASRSLLSLFGIGVQSSKDKSLDELQELAMSEIEQKE